MDKTSIEIVSIGSEDTTAIDSAISFLNRHQEAFLFEGLREKQFESYAPEQYGRYTTWEIYELFERVLSGSKGFHHLIIGVVENQLDGKKWGNLFGAVQTENGKLVGKAITSLYGVSYLIHPMPIALYLIYEFLSFASRFIVAKKMIHDDERGCLFHRKVQKTDIVSALQTGYLCLNCQQKINQYLDLTQIIAFRTILSIISEIARSDDPQKNFQNYMTIEDILDDTAREEKGKRNCNEMLYKSEKQSFPFPLQKKIIKFLASIPNIHDNNAQRALIYGAGLDPQLEQQIVYGGPSAQFFHLLVSTLKMYGRLEDGRNALEAVLESAKEHVGQDKRAYCETLIQDLQSPSSEMTEYHSSDRATTIEADNNIKSPYTPVSNIRKTKILFLGANPASSSRLRLDEEMKRIQTNFKIAKEREHLILKQEWAVTVDTLVQAILDESPTIVHFSGHGKSEGIILQDEHGEPKTVTADALASLFKLFKDSVYCVILNSCYSKIQAEAIKRYIPYVIGVETRILDKAALAFSTGFYKAIGAGRDVPFAFDLGVATIKLEGVANGTTPVLL